MDWLVRRNLQLFGGKKQVFYRGGFGFWSNYINRLMMHIYLIMYLSINSTDTTGTLTDFSLVHFRNYHISMHDLIQMVTGILCLFSNVECVIFALKTNSASFELVRVLHLWPLVCHMPHTIAHLQSMKKTDLRTNHQCSDKYISFIEEGLL